MNVEALLSPMRPAKRGIGTRYSRRATDTVRFVGGGGGRVLTLYWSVVHFVSVGLAVRPGAGGSGGVAEVEI